MKRYLLPLIALVFLFGCFGGGPEGELNVIPEKANAYAVLRIADMLNDQDFMDSMETADEREEFQTNIQKLKDDFGVDPYAVEKITIFLDTESLSGKDAYGGLIFFGEVDKGKLLSKIKEKNDLTEIEYNGFMVYEASENLGKDISSVESDSSSKTTLVFLNSKTVVLGSMEAVKDAIDVKNGNTEPMSNANLDKVSSSVQKNAQIFLAMKMPESLKDAEDSMSSRGPFDASSLSKMTYLAFSYGKKNSVISLKASMLFESQKDASKVSDLVEGLILMSAGMLDEGSASKKLVKSIEIGSKEDIVTMALDTTKEDIEKVSEEMNEMNSKPYSPSYDDSYGDDYAAGDDYEDDTPQEVCAMPAGMSCIDFYLSSETNILDITIVNGFQKPIVITNAVCSQDLSDYTSNWDYGEIELPSLGLQYLDLQCSDETGIPLDFDVDEPFTGRINIEYYFEEEGEEARRRISGNIYVVAG